MGSSSAGWRVCSRVGEDGDADDGESHRSAAKWEVRLVGAVQVESAVRRVGGPDGRADRQHDSGTRHSMVVRTTVVSPNKTPRSRL